METEDTTSTTMLTTDDGIYESDYDSEEYDYSDFEELWDSYYSNEDDGTLYSTTGLDSSSLSDLGSAEELISSDAVASVVAAFVSAMLVISIISLLYSIYMAIVKFMIAKKMGRGTGFAVASIFFWPIMAGILAFSKNKGEATTKPAESTNTEAQEAQVVPGAPVQPSKS